ncbi:uncharacterized protein LOC143148407 [Ptiloglossa arizonensis]|uniref:uncharacterized protein LOC143148407 n=1 Tax=Ptiloglossa arizonensis TaxID=3350558 RepID=UPI003F9FD8B6
MRYTLFFFIVGHLSVIRCQRLTDVVQTDKGRVQGRILETAWHSMPYSAFLGIPYAKPPVGSLRFQAPVETDPWTDVVKTIDNVPPCMQYIGVGPLGQEDCLYLNVHTPTMNFTNIETLKSVMVWIYGGGFQIGTAHQGIYGPDFILEEDVVFVSLNYRLGALGFLALKLPGAQGNQGLKDQNLALQWVQRNIAKFGGDPNQVTIFGESAGGASVGYHLLSSKSHGLFQKAISQSGTPISPWAYQAPTDAIIYARKLAEKLNIVANNNVELLIALKQASATDIVNAVGSMTSFQLPMHFSFLPTIEVDLKLKNTFLEDCPIKYLVSGNFTRVPTMLGYNTDESSLFIAGFDIVRQEVRNILLYIVRWIDPFGTISFIINTVNSYTNTTLYNMIKPATLHDFSGLIDLMQRLLTKYNDDDSPVYYYRLSYDTKNNLHRALDSKIDGTAHTDDLDLLFHIGLISPTDPSEPYNVYRKRVVSMWTNFAKFGNPTPAKLFSVNDQWLPSGREGLQLDIGNELFVMTNRSLPPDDQSYMETYFDMLPYSSVCISYTSKLFDPYEYGFTKFRRKSLTHCRYYSARLIMPTERQSWVRFTWTVLCSLQLYSIHSQHQLYAHTHIHKSYCIKVSHTVVFNAKLGAKSAMFDHGPPTVTFYHPPTIPKLPPSKFQLKVYSNDHFDKCTKLLIPYIKSTVYKTKLIVLMPLTYYYVLFFLTMTYCVILRHTTLYFSRHTPRALILFRSNPQCLSLQTFGRLARPPVKGYSYLPRNLAKRWAPSNIPPDEKVQCFSQDDANLFFVSLRCIVSILLVDHERIKQNNAMAFITIQRRINYPFRCVTCPCTFERRECKNNIDLFPFNLKIIQSIRSVNKKEVITKSYRVANISVENILTRVSTELHFQIFTAYSGLYKPIYDYARSCYADELDRTMKYALLQIIMLYALTVKCQHFTQVIQTDKGDVRGRILPTAFHSMPYSVFYGIPFAKPPVGDLRFKDPVEADPWTDVKTVIRESSMCTQYLNIGPRGEEDCLYLNVYTPVLDFTNITTLKPVMVLIHSSAFITGSNAKNLQGPDWFIEDDIVMVAMNYRLGPLGFLALGLPDASGNQALKDQNLAMQWVQKNIAKFGGDPNRVTLLGMSSGAASVNYHMFSPKSRGLFHQVIMQSGTALCPWAYKTPTDSLSEAHLLGRNMGIYTWNASELLISLKKADVVDIVNGAMIMNNLHLPLPINIAFLPTYETGADPENIFLDDCPLSYFKTGNFTRVPTMIGYNTEEMILFIAIIDVARQMLNQYTQTFIKTLKWIIDLSNVMSFLNSYTYETILNIIETSSAYFMRVPIDLTQKLLTKDDGNNLMYYYRLSYDTKYNFHRLLNSNLHGTSHIDDLPLLFRIEMFTPTDPDNSYNLYCKRIVSMWTNFIKYGNPTPPDSNMNDTHWEPSGQQGLQLDIGNTLFTMKNRLLSSDDELNQKLYYDTLSQNAKCKHYKLHLTLLLVPFVQWQSLQRIFVRYAPKEMAPERMEPAVTPNAIFSDTYKCDRIVQIKFTYCLRQKVQPASSKCLTSYASKTQGHSPTKNTSRSRRVVTYYENSRVPNVELKQSILSLFSLCHRSVPTRDIADNALRTPHALPRVWLAFTVLASSTQCLVVCIRETPVVRTSVGPIRGTILRTVWNSHEYSSFKGIPYAKPPTGNLRFKPPVPVKPWKKTLNAFHEGNVCPQIDTSSANLIGSEDCLYLNVFTPKTQFEDQLNSKAVMVWIHGGAYMAGYSNASLYGPDFFLEEDIVLVSFNYRLGVLGFLSLNHPRATGNAGLKDQNLVLQWVQNNIAAFGGDPRRVTIFGESAGASSVGFHTLSEKSRDLFVRSISMSGSPLCPWAYQAPEEAIQHARDLAALLGFLRKDKTGLLNFFLRTPAPDIVIASTNVGLDILPFRPTIENPNIVPHKSVFLTECPITKYQSGKFNQQPMMLGYTNDEMLMFLGPAFRPINITEQIKKFLNDTIKQNRGTLDKAMDQLMKLIDRVSEMSIEEIVKITTDLFFRGPIDLTQKLLVKHNQNYSVYYYQVSQQTQYSMHRLNGNPLNGTAHTDDIGYIFNVEALHAPTDPTDPFNQFRKKMVELWANFAKYGNPTPISLKNASFNVVWADSGDSGLQLDINEMFTMHNRLVDQKTEDYEKALHIILALISACRHKLVNYRNVF